MRSRIVEQDYKSDIRQHYEPEEEFMETLAFIHASAAYDDPSPEPEMRSLEELRAAVSKSTAVGLASGAAVLSTMAIAPDAEAALRRGDRCSNVRLAQGALLNQGFSTNGIDGVFGSSTESAVRRFQSANGLFIDGVIGPSTARQLGLRADISCSDSGDSTSAGRVRVTTSGGSLNARSGPGTSFRVVRQYANGTILNVTGRTRNGFSELTNGLWVSSDFVRRVGDSGGETPSGGRVRVSTSGSPLNARYGPGTSFGVGRQYANGTILNTTGRTRSGWIELTNGLWVDDNFVRRLSDGGETPSGGRIRISTNGGNLNARSGPSSSSSVVRQYSNGTVLNTTGRTRNGFVELTNGLWVASQWVVRL